MMKHNYKLGFYISMVDKTDYQYHRSHIILHSPNGFYLAEFDNIDQLDFFARTLGFNYTTETWEESERFGIYREYSIDHNINDDKSFWNIEQIPEGAKPIKALSNGSIVTCYFINDGKTITIYRPNPNSKSVYKPLPTDQHIKHRQIYGCY